MVVINYFLFFGSYSPLSPLPFAIARTLSLFSPFPLPAFPLALPLVYTLSLLPSPPLPPFTFSLPLHLYFPPSHSPSPFSLLFLPHSSPSLSVPPSLNLVGRAPPPFPHPLLLYPAKPLCPGYEKMGKVLESKGMGGKEKGHGRDKEGAKWRGGGVARRMQGRDREGARQRK